MIYIPRYYSWTTYYYTQLDFHFLWFMQVLSICGKFLDAKACPEDRDDYCSMMMAGGEL